MPSAELKALQQARISDGKRRYVPSTEVDGGELPHCQKRKALRTNVVRGV